MPRLTLAPNVCQAYGSARPIFRPVLNLCKTSDIWLGSFMIGNLLIDEHLSAESIPFLFWR
jgi:hypothetical protein